MDGINQPSRIGNFEQIVMMNLIFMINHFNLKYFENLNDSIKNPVHRYSFWSLFVEFFKEIHVIGIL